MFLKIDRLIKTNKDLEKYIKYLNKAQNKKFSSLDFQLQKYYNSQRRNFVGNYYNVNDEKSYALTMNNSINEIDKYTKSTIEIEKMLLQKRLNKAFTKKERTEIEEQLKVIENSDYQPEFIDNIGSLTGDEVKALVKEKRGIDNFILPFDPASYLKEKHNHLYSNDLDNKDEKALKIITDNNLFSKYSNFCDYQKIICNEVISEIACEAMNNQHCIQNYRDDRKKNRVYEDYDQSKHFLIDIHYDKGFVSNMKRPDGSIGGRKIDYHFIGSKFDVKAGLKLRHSTEKMLPKMAQFNSKALFALEQKYSFLEKNALGNDLEAVQVLTNKALNDIQSKTDLDIFNIRQELINGNKDIINKDNAFELAKLFADKYENDSVKSGDLSVYTKLKEMTIEEIKENFKTDDLFDFINNSFNNIIQTSELYDQEKILIEILSQDLHYTEIQRQLREKGITIDNFKVQTIKTSKGFKKKTNNKQITFKNIDLSLEFNKLSKKAIVALNKFEDQRFVESKIKTKYGEDDIKLKDIKQLITNKIKHNQCTNLNDLAEFFEEQSVFIDLKIKENDKINGLSFVVHVEDQKVRVKSSLLFEKNEIEDLLKSVVKKGMKENNQSLDNFEDEYVKQIKEMSEYSNKLSGNVQYFNVYYKDIALMHQNDFLLLFKQNNRSFWQTKLQNHGDDYYDRWNNKRLSITKNSNDSKKYSIYGNNKTAENTAIELIFKNAIEDYKKDNKITIVSSKNQELLDKVYFEKYFNADMNNLIELKMKNNFGQEVDYVPSPEILMKIKQKVNDCNVKSYDKMLKRFDKYENTDNSKKTFYFPDATRTNQSHSQDLREPRIKILNDAICEYGFVKIANYNEKHLIEDKEKILFDAKNRFPDKYHLVENFFKKYNNFEKAIIENTNENKAKIKENTDVKNDEIKPKQRKKQSQSTKFKK